MKIKYYFIVFFLFSYLEAKSHILMIDDIVEIALKYSPDIDSSHLDFKLAKQRAKMAESVYLPNLDLTVSRSKQWTKLHRYSLVNINVLMGRLNASQLLYDFGKTANKIRSTHEEISALHAQMQQVISDKIFEIKKSYYDILKTKNIIDVHHENKKLLKKQLFQAEKHYVAKIKTEIDISHIKIELAQASLDLENTQFELENKRINLEQFIGTIPYNGNYILYNEKFSIENLNKNLPTIQISVGELETFAYKHRYLMQNSEYILKASESNIESVKGNYYPTISLNGDYTLQDADINDVVILPTNYGQIGINISWNLFSGYHTDSSVEEAKVLALKATSRLNSVKLLIQKQVKNAELSVRRNRKNVKQSLVLVKKNFKKFKNVRNRYKNVTSDYIQMEEAHKGYIQSLASLVNNYYNYYTSIAALDHAIGK